MLCAGTNPTGGGSVVVVVEVVVPGVKAAVVDVSVGSGLIVAGAMIGSLTVCSRVVVHDAASNANSNKVVRGRDAIGEL